ncbi:type II secretion system minor pseudopilin GspI [Derxia gummosa]|uniref:Type II secretion system protein I n=1 Tax=Derxia gummosa DSM 723 TaxID=1121388 RepID=A0A8B6X5W8_9BURK|nr:type II secretion system minor pseudopilin GspI [Derxia gummosa]
MTRRAVGFARGFTLVEVLVALVIVGVALGASLRAVGGMARQNEVLRAKLYAGWSASNRIAELRATRVQPAIGQRSFQCPQGRLELVCDEDVKATGNRYMRRVEITVYSDASRREWLTTVSTVLANGSDM